MARRPINIDEPNTNRGDDLREAFGKVESNFSELYQVYGSLNLPSNLDTRDFTGTITLGTTSININDASNTITGLDQINSTHGNFNESANIANIHFSGNDISNAQGAINFGETQTTISHIPTENNDVVNKAYVDDLVANITVDGVIIPNYRFQIDEQIEPFTLPLLDDGNEMTIELDEDNTIPQGIAIGNGEIYVINDENDRIYVYNLITGESLRNFSTTNITGLAFYNNELYGINFSTRSVSVYNSETSSFVRTITLSTTNNSPAAIAVNNDEIYVVYGALDANDEVNVFNRNTGAFIREFNLNTTNNISHGASFYNNRLYVGNFSGGNVYIYNPDTGSFLGEFSLNRTISGISVHNGELYSIANTSRLIVVSNIFTVDGLPNGLGFNPENRTVSGTPSTPAGSSSIVGLHPITYHAGSHNATFNIIIFNPPLSEITLRYGANSTPALPANAPIDRGTNRFTITFPASTTGTWLVIEEPMNFTITDVYADGFRTDGTGLFTRGNGNLNNLFLYQLPRNIPEVTYIVEGTRN